MEAKMDKSFYKKQSLQQADNNVKFWMSKTPSERFKAAFMLSLRVYGHDPMNPPEMDKTYYRHRTRA